MKQWPWPSCGASLALGIALKLLRGPSTELLTTGCIKSLSVTSHNLIEKWFAIVVYNKRRQYFKRTIFLFSISSWGTHFSSFFTFPIGFKRWTTIEWSTLSSATSRVVERGPASMFALSWSCQLPMAGNYAPHLQGAHLLCKTSWTTTALHIHYQFVGQIYCWCCKLSPILYDSFWAHIRK